MLTDNKYYIDDDDDSDDNDNDTSTDNDTGKFSSTINRTRRNPRAVSLDSLANHSFGWNQELFVDIIDKSYQLNGVNGRSHGTRVGRMPCFGDVVITPNSEVNAIALCDAEKYRVEYHSKVKFVVHLSEKLIINFDYNDYDKSYTCIFTDELLVALYDHESSVYGIHVVSCSDNEKLFSKGEVTAAQNAREMIKRLYYPSDVGLVNTLAKGRMLNTSVTPQDVLRVTKIYGRDVPFIKGKTVIPTNHTASVLLDGVNKVIGKIRARGYTIFKFTTDPEASFKCLDGMIDVLWDTIGSRTHVEHAEREIRVIKERLRSLEYGVSFRIARRFAKWTVYGRVSALNATRQNYEGISAREAFTDIKADYKRDFRVAFGDYAQVAVETKPSNRPAARTVGAMALCGSGNSKGSVYWYD